jgi:putative ABC transport system permease protein
MRTPLRHLPLAWLELTHDRRHLLTSVAGITFAVVLMYMQVGFLNGFYDSQVQLVRSLNGTLIITSKRKQVMLHNEPFPRKRIAQARAVAGVEAAYAVYVEQRVSVWKNLRDRRSRPIRVLAFDPDEPVFVLPEVREQAPLLRLPDTVLFDEASKAVYGPREVGVETELARRSVRVVGTFRLGTDFISDGNVIMSDTNFAKYFPDRHAPETTRDRVELGVVRVDPSADPGEVLQRLRRALPEDVVVLPKEEFSQREKEYWRHHTPLDFVFGLGSVLGFVVGVIICYQILFTDVLDHLPQFATLKAIGYPNRFLVKVVVQEALWLAVLGFIPGLGLSYGLYQLLAAWTGLPMALTPGRIGLVLLLTVAMCLVAGLLAVRRALRADPAEVF